MAALATIKLRIGITLAYLLAAVPLTTGMMGYLYWSNASLMVDTATESMARTVQSVRNDVKNLINPVAHSVASTAELVRADRGSIRRVRNLGFFNRQVSALPQVFSLFMGFENNGDFYQIFRIPPTLEKLGPDEIPLTDDIKHAVRFIDDSSGRRADSFIFYGDWGDVRKVARGPVRYDPRARPWYRAVWEKPGVTISNTYVFASSGLVGLTVSRRIATASGARIGVIGADITLDTLTKFLQRQRIGEHGQVFLLDEEDHLIGHHQQPEMGFVNEGGKIRLLKADSVPDPIVAGAVKAWKRTGKDKFEADIGSGGETFMLSFSKFMIGDGRKWTIAVAVQRDELVGPLKQTSLEIMMAGGLVLILSIYVINWLSGYLTDPIRLIVEKTNRIRAFDLEGALDTSSRIEEVHQLTDAVQTMTRSLRSFSVYVPRDLVRAIVSENRDVALSSRRQPLTVMFSDIKGFTSIAESLPPERLVGALNEYFELLTPAVRNNKGVIDKFIGDAIMGLWNAPTEDENHVINGCRAVLACREASNALDVRFVEAGQTPFFTRFGLHTGEAIVGNVGSSVRMQYSAFGAVINYAARLEALNKAYGTQILVSEEIFERCDEMFLFRRMDKVVPVGTSQPKTVYELMGERETMKLNGDYAVIEARCDAWEQGLDLYFSMKWQKALSCFETYCERYPDDQCAEVFVGRCNSYLLNPPPEDWDGAERFTHK